MPKITATLPAKWNHIRTRPDSPSRASVSILALTPGDRISTAKVILCLDWFWSERANSSQVICIARVFDQGSGKGVARGYGYNKRDASAYEALRDAGISFSSESETNQCLFAVCTALGHDLANIKMVNHN